MLLWSYLSYFTNSLVLREGGKHHFFFLTVGRSRDEMTIFVYCYSPFHKYICSIYSYGLLKMTLDVKRPNESCKPLRYVSQVWWIVRSWSRWNEATACPAPKAAPSPSMRWWGSAGRRSQMKGRLLNTSSRSWKTTLQPQSRSTSQGTTSRWEHTEVTSSEIKAQDNRASENGIKPWRGWWERGSYA